MTRFALALWKETIYWGMEEEEKNQLYSHTLTSPSQLSEVLQEVLMPFKNKTFDAIGVIRGPGSFTGLRVLLASIHGVILTYPATQVFSPTFFDVTAYHQKKRPLMILGTPHGNQHIGALFSTQNDYELFTEIPRSLGVHVEYLDHSCIHWANHMLAMPWTQHAEKYPLPFYGYHPTYRKK